MHEQRIVFDQLDRLQVLEEGHRALAAQVAKRRSIDNEPVDRHLKRRIIDEDFVSDEE